MSSSTQSIPENAEDADFEGSPAGVHSTLTVGAPVDQVWRHLISARGTEALLGPGVTLGVQRGFPKIGDEAFPGHQNFNNTLVKFMDEGGKVYACRFALQALYGHGEPSLIPGIIPISPLDVLDLTLLHRNENAFMLHTWTL